MFKQLLVPLDGSALAEAALPLTQAIAGRFESKVTLPAIEDLDAIRSHEEG